MQRTFGVPANRLVGWCEWKNGEVGAPGTVPRYEIGMGCLRRGIRGQVSVLRRADLASVDSPAWVIRIRLFRPLRGLRLANSIVSPGSRLGLRLTPALRTCHSLGEFTCFARLAPGATISRPLCGLVIRLGNSPVSPSSRLGLPS